MVIIAFAGRSAGVPVPTLGYASSVSPPHPRARPGPSRAQPAACGRQKRAVAEYLAGLEAAAQDQEGTDRNARSRAAEDDLAFRSVVGVDGEN